MKQFQNKIFSVLLCISLLASSVISVHAATVITIVDSVGDVGLYSSLKLNNSSFPVISYFDDTNHNLKVAVCSDAICSSKTLTTVDNALSVGDFTSLELNSNGFPVISYFDDATENLKVAVCANANCTNKTLTVVDSVGLEGWDTSLALNSSGFPVISYHNMATEDLKVAVCSNVTCTSKTLTIVDGGGTVGRFSSLVLNNNDFPVISYYDYTNQDLKLAVCSDAICASKTLTTVDSVGNVGSYTSIALNNSGFPVISYYDVLNSDLKVAVCSNTTCTSNTITTVDSLGSVGSNISLTLNSNGFPIISYQDYTNADLKLAICLNTTCTNKTLTTVDSQGDLGAYYTSLALDSNDSPVISYYDLTNRDLKVAVLGYTTPLPIPLTTSLPRTGFAPMINTKLPIQQANESYSALGDIWLDIPSLNVKSDIVGVPQSLDSWNVDWLGNSTGWLNGTTFPSWEGNSVLTAHVTDSNGLPGPFANIKDLKYGDQIIVHMYGEKYIFEVRDSSMVFPSSTNSALEHLEGHSYLTLITCQWYNPITNSYTFRRVVRAVLVSVQGE